MTIKDIARLSGCAVGTVSRVLNGHPDVSDATREKVMAVVKEYGFRPNSNAKHLKQQASYGIAIIVKGTRNMLFASLVELLQAHIKDRGYTAFPYYIEEEENEVEQAIQICRERRPYGILFLGSNLEFFRTAFHQVTVPCVMVTNSGATFGFENLASVATDDETAAASAVRYLLEQGHRKIGVLGGRMEASLASCARMQGVRRAMEEYSLDFDMDSQYSFARFSVQSGYRAMECLLKKMPDVTAVFAMGDVMAIGAIRALHDHGKRVPQDISIVGFDGIEMASYCTPKLTTIQQHDAVLARRGVELLLDQVEKGREAAHEWVEFHLSVGESVMRAVTE